MTATETSFLRISLKQEDIDRGDRTAGGCPIALAVLRDYPDYGYALVHNGRLRLINPPGATLWQLPDEAVKFMRAFDNGSVVSPIEFVGQFVRAMSSLTAYMQIVVEDAAMKVMAERP